MLDCWDGVNSDSSDHRSHVAYGNGPECPSTHPKRIPQITFETIYYTDDYDIQDIFLSTGDNTGYSKPFTLSSIINQNTCTNMHLQQFTQIMHLDGKIMVQN
jgi:hypothetical protein